MARNALDTAGLLGRTRMMASGREWAAGDRLVCRRNDYRLGVRNGTRGTVADVELEGRALRVRTDDGASVQLPEEYLGDVQQGYALTGHISQGATVERTYLLATPDRGGREWPFGPPGLRPEPRRRWSQFAVHHEPERMAEHASARALSR